MQVSTLTILLAVLLPVCSGQSPANITEYAVPTPNAYLDDITAGPDGALWFTEFEGNKIGRITALGAIVEYPLPTPSAKP